ncbi:MAG: MerR family transcriptional regulator [Lachnospiraceae bacterium]|nr:MerR family transcriptional regulator [Lachnospiraceae bacterium]
MKINQVEELVDITKKNIRFYEDQGLLNPKRNPENGYREYSLEDTEELFKIKLLRKLSIPIEDIKKVQRKELTLSDCFSKQVTRMESEIKSMETALEFCKSMSDQTEDYENLNASKYLDEIRKLEEGGERFMDIRNNDVKKKKNGALIAAIVFCAIVLFFVGMVVIAGGNEGDTEAIPAIIIMGTVGIAFIVGCIIALIQRFKELEGGEEDEASKY